MTVIKGTYNKFWLLVIITLTISFLIGAFIFDKITDALFIPVFMLIPVYFSSYNSYYNFVITEKEIIVSNSLRPFFNKAILLKNIIQVEIKGVAYRGRTVVIRTESKNYFYAANHILREDLQIIMDGFNKYRERKVR